MALRALGLCDGYGGFELGFRAAGLDVSTVARVERDSYAAAVLVARMEEQTLDQAPVWDDLTTFDGAAWRGRVDLITAGFPCQPFSSAGSRAGVDDERWLWPDIARIIADVGPWLVLLENVPELVRHGLPYVCADLAELGFDAEWGLFSAAAVGAPHRRQRFWLLASGQDVGDAGGVMQRGERVDERHAVDEVQGSSIGVASFVGDIGSEGRSEVPGGAHGDEGTVAGWGADGTDVVADPESARRQGQDERRTEHTGPTRRSFPPSPDDHPGWDRWTAEGGPEPTVRRSSDGRPLGLADALHLGGNGLVPLVAGCAFLQLAERLGVDVTRPRVLSPQEV